MERLETHGQKGVFFVDPMPALVYGEHGQAQTQVAFAEGEGFVGNFLRLLGEPARSAQLHFLAPIAPGELAGRRQIAELARERIVQAMAA